MHAPERQLCKPSHAMPRIHATKATSKDDELVSTPVSAIFRGGMQSQSDAYVSTRHLRCLFWMRDAGRLDTRLLCVGRNLENARDTLASSLYTHAQCAPRQLLLSIRSLVDR